MGRVSNAFRSHDRDYCLGDRDGALVTLTEAEGLVDVEVERWGVCVVDQRPGPVQRAAQAGAVGPVQRARARTSDPFNEPEPELGKR